MAIPFIVVDAKTTANNATRSAKVNVSTIAYVLPAGDAGDPNGPAAIYFSGGLHSPNERIVTQQTAAQVVALIDAANV